MRRSGRQYVAQAFFTVTDRRGSDMFTTLLLGSALATGQPPALPEIPILPAKVSAQTAPQPMPIPKVMPSPMAMPATLPPVVVSPAPAAAAEAPAAPAEEPPAPATKYLAEKLLEGTPFGQLLSDRGIKVYGWTQMNYTLSSASKTNAPTTFNDRANEFQMNQTWLRIDKAVDTTKKELQYGFHVDAFVGTDARYTVPRGLFDNQLRNGKDGAPRNYPADIYSMYGEAFLPGLGTEGTTLRVGRFATHCSYEVGPGLENTFVSRSYGFQFNPFTHTGFWAITPLNDTWTMSNGLALGSDNFIDPASRLTYIGQLKWAPKEGKTQVLFNTVVTNPKYITSEAFNIYNTYNLQVTHKINDNLTYVLDGTFSHEDNFPGVGSANWYGVVNYLFLKHNDKLTSNFRAEVFEDSKGIRTGTRGTYFETTYGLNWTPRDSVIVRPFVRYDYNKNGPFEGGDKNLYTGGMELILRF